MTIRSATEGRGSPRAMAATLSAAGRSVAIRPAPRHAGRRHAALDLPQRDHQQLEPLLAAHEHQRAVAQVAHAPGPVVLFGASRLPRLGDPRDDLGLGVERPADALAVTVGRVVGDGDEHGSALLVAPGRPVAVALTLAGVAPAARRVE